MNNKFYQLITRDGIKTALLDLDEVRPSIVTIERTQLKQGFGNISIQECLDNREEIKTREYRFKKAIPATIYIYEEE
jgi:hypothetical protein